MVDVEIEDVDEGGVPYETKRVPPTNQDSSSFSQFGTSTCYFML